jgi:protein arginine kinase
LTKIKLWFDDKINDDNVCMSSRIRFARNLRDFNFVSTMSDLQKREVANKIREVFFDNNLDKNNLNKKDILNKNDVDKSEFIFLDIKNTNENRLIEMFENYAISNDFVVNKSDRFLLFNKNNSKCIMINEEDHLRIQTYEISEKLDIAFKSANFIDDFISSKIYYAFSAKYGFLTSCLSNLGTGMRASCMLHIPMLEQLNQLDNLKTEIMKFGIIMRGFHGENTKSYGNIYQFSNQITIGLNEKEIINNLKNIIEQIVAREMKFRIEEMNRNKIALEDIAYRSFAILSNCRFLTLLEAMKLISNVKLDYSLGIDLPKLKSSLHNIITKIQPGHIRILANTELNEQDYGEMRANIVRKEFS